MLSGGSWLRRALLLALALGVLLAAAVLLGPRLVNLPGVQARLERQLSDATHGSLAWDALDVRLFPAPRGILHGARISVPDVVEGRIEQVEVQLDLLALLFGRVVVDAAHLVRPTLRITVPASERESATTPLDPIAAYRKAAQSIADRVRQLAPDLEFSVREGQFEVAAPGLPSAVQVALTAAGRSDARALALTASSAGRLWERVEATARLDYASLAAQVELTGTGLKPQPLLDHYLAGAVARLAAPSGSAQATLQTDGRSSLQARLTLDVPALSVARGDSAVELHAVHVDAAATASAQAIEVSLAALRLGEVLPGASARLRIATEGSAQLSIDAPAMDLARLRSVATMLAGEQMLVQRYVARVRAGQLSGLHLTAQAPSLRGLADPAAIGLTLNVTGGAMLVPYLERDVDEISGTLDWHDGVVSARAVSGRLGGTRIANGAFDYWLREKRMQISSAYDLDAAQALEIARALPHAPRNVLDAVRAARGRADGRLVVTRTPGDWKVDFAVSRSDAVLTLRDLPWPAMLRAGRIAFTPGRLSVDAASGTIGASTFQALAVDMPTGAPVRIEAARGSGTLALPELFAWARARKGMTDKLTGIGALEGTLDFTLHRLAGRVDNLVASDHELTVRPRQVRARLEALPGPLLLDGGSVTLTRQAMRLDRVGGALLDARARVSGTVHDYSKRARRIDVGIAEGETGERFMTWAYRRSGAPAHLQSKTPVRFAAQRLRWSAADGLDLRGQAQIAAGPNLDADLAWKPGRLDVRSMRIQDQDSDATLGVALRERSLDLRFAGNLTARTLDRAFAQSLDERGRVEGEFHVTIDREQPGRSDGRGRLRGEDIGLERFLGRPLTLERIDVDADASRLRITQASIDYAGQKATIAGEVTHASAGLVVDARIDTPGIVLDGLLQPTASAPAQPGAPQSNGPAGLARWPLPLTGKLALRAGYLEYLGYRVEPVVATLALEPERARLDLTEGMLCGIRFPFQLELTRGGMVASALVTAHSQQLQAVAHCITSQRVLVTGAFDLRADLRTHGHTDELLDNAEGGIELHARDGKVMKFALLGNILSLKAVASLLKGDGRIREEGFDYRSMDLHSRIEEGRLVVEEGSFDSAAVGLAATGSVRLRDRDTNLTVLVAPFSRADQLVRRIPIVGYILGGTLTSVPVAVSGDIADPVVVPLDPRAVTTELLGIFERTLKLPTRLFEPRQDAAKPGGGAR